MTQFIVFKSNEDKIDVYINNKLYKKLLLKDFTNFRSVRLNMMLYDFISAKSTSEECKIRGHVVIISTSVLTTERNITIKVGDKKHSETFDKVGTDIFYSDLIRYICETMNRMGYAKLYEEPITHAIESINAAIAETTAIVQPKEIIKPPILILNRLVNFYPTDVGKWESEKFNIFGECIHYNISEAVYNVNEKTIDNSKFNKGDGKPYTLKRYSFVKGSSSNIISTDSSIYILTQAAEVDLVKCITKKETAVYNVQLFNSMLFVLSTIDDIMQSKKYTDNELYDYTKLRDCVCRFIESSAGIRYSASKVLLVTNYIANLLTSKREVTGDSISKIERCIMILLSIETEKEKQSGRHTNIPNLLSDALKMLNFSK